MLVLSRYIAARYGIESTKSHNITLKGENRHDILIISKNQLVALEGANNYVAVYYLVNEQLQKKLLRTTLKKIHQQVPDMTQVHRSYLVNKNHFVEWKDNLSMTLTQLTVPVSKKYKPNLNTLFTVTTK